MASPRRRRGRRAPLVELDPRAARPLHEQIYEQLRDAALAGRLTAGDRLASSRTLARDWAVSRFTVVSAIDRLVAEGYLLPRRGSGMYVADVLPDSLLRAKTKPPARRPAAIGQGAPALSSRGRAVSQVVITGPRLEGGPRPFHPRRPALDLFPVRTWAGLLARYWRAPRTQDLDYGPPAGDALLRRAIAEHLGESRGVRCTPDQVIVTGGAQQAFDVLGRVLLDPGDAVWMEEPGYLDVRAALVAAGATLVPVRVDREGLDVSAGVAAAPRARLCVVSPAHQYPMGVTLSASRRAALVEWARAANAWIIEDDYDCYFRYRGRPVPALQRLDADTADAAAARVLYVGTFSKTMFPALRLGFCVVPPALVDAVGNARAVAARNAPTGDQRALAAFVLDGHYDRHLRRCRVAYEERHHALQTAFARAGAPLAFAAADAGTHVIAWPGTARPPAGFAAAVSEAAAREGLVVFPLSRYCLLPPRPDGFVLGYGGARPPALAAAARQLTRILGSLR